MLDRSTGSRRALAWLMGLAWLGIAGCTGISAREAYVHNAVRDARERIEADEEPSPATVAVLTRHRLLAEGLRDPALAAPVLEARLASRPEAGGALALAELSYRAGLAQDADASSMAWFRDAAALSSIALAEPSLSNPDLARDLHNRALARLIRLSQDAHVRDGRDWRTALEAQGVVVDSTTPFLAPGSFSNLRVVDDIRTSGMAHVYKNDGLGVPLIARRLVDKRDSPNPSDHYIPRNLKIAATAVLATPGGLEGGAWRKSPATIALVDPFIDRTMALGGRPMTVAGDRTTPLAVQVAESKLPTLELTGLFRSSFLGGDLKPGLSMLRPYEPGKIPVVLVHGLVSSPRAFVQTVNEMRNDPAIYARFQFWVFIYPTGEPIPDSAAQLRAGLLKIREDLDPSHADLALDRMVVVGHSMGGLLTKMMVQDPGMELFKASIRLPYDQLRAAPRFLARINDLLIFRPVPSVRRVVFIATPHRGSPIANDFIGQTIAGMIQPPREFRDDMAELDKFKGRAIFTPEMRKQPLNAIGNLRTDSPILLALDKVPLAAGIPAHSIIPLIGGQDGFTDGVVLYNSSHIDGVRSELIVPGTHFSQQHPDVTLELKRILLEHAGTAQDSTVPAAGPRGEGAR